MTRIGRRYFGSAPANRSCTNSSFPPRNSRTRSYSSSNFSGENSLLKPPQATVFSVRESRTVNLSLGVRPVNGAVYPTMAPLEASLDSPRRMECCTSSAGKRLRCTFFCCDKNWSISMDFTTDWVTIRARYSCTAETYILTKRVGISGQNSSRQRLGSFFAQNGIQMAQCFRHGQGIHLTGAVKAGFDSLLQIMSGDLDRQWVRDVM